jgi:hypothetical protein
VNTPGGWVRPFGPEVEGKSTVSVAASLGRVGGVSGRPEAVCSGFDSRVLLVGWESGKVSQPDVQT